jgi:hypothetical protein
MTKLISALTTLRSTIDALPDEECEFFNPQKDLFHRLREQLQTHGGMIDVIPIISKQLDISQYSLTNLFYFMSDCPLSMAELDSLPPASRKRLFLHILDTSIEAGGISIVIPEWVHDDLAIMHIPANSSNPQEPAI